MRMFRSVSQSDESQLLLLIKQGDTCAFEKLYRTYSPMLYSNVLRMVKFPETAEEIIQEVFMKVWERREQVDTEKSFKSYLFTIAKHLVYDFFHRQVKQRRLETDLIAVSTELFRHVEEVISRKETAHAIEQAISKLPRQRKLVYTLCKIEGKSYEETARLLGISVSTISDHIVKATKILQASPLSQHLFGLLIAWPAISELV